MKKLIVIIVILSYANILLAQGKDKGDLYWGWSVGPGTANLLNSEAPHKLYTGSGETLNPANLPIIYSDQANEYKTNIIKDILYGIAAGIEFEYFIKDNTSVNSGLFYERKGINLNYSDINKKEYNTIKTSSVVEKKVSNNYLTTPVLIRKYFSKKKAFFAEGGIYAGILAASKVNTNNELEITDETGRLKMSSRSKIEFNGFRQTNKLDFGILLGTGFIKNISERVLFKTELKMGFGIIKIDSKNNNEYAHKDLPPSSGYYSITRSSNYYGLNSKAKNMNCTLTFGFAYIIDNKKGNG